MLSKLIRQLAFLIILITDFLSAGSLQAREITPEFNLKCAYQVKGAITDRTLRELVQSADSIDESMWYENTAICLDSPGGDFVAGKKIARLINQKGWRTAVKSKANCLSACAIAFMGGTDSVGMYNYRSRVVYPGGTIGFHAPRLVIDKGLYSGTTVSHAYQTALISIKGLIDMVETKFTHGNSALFNNYLLDKVISTPPTGLWQPRTINEAALADMDIWAPPPLVDHRYYINMCDNFVSRYGADGKTSNPAEQIQNERAQNRAAKPEIIFSKEYAWVPGYWRGARNTMVCRVKLKASSTYMAGPAHLVQLIEHDWNTEPPIDLATPYAIEMHRGAAPGWFGYNPSTQLSDLR